MAGHNKWSSIKHKKGAADAKRGKIFSKISKEITVAVKMGGEDPTSNPRLRAAINAGKAANMPNDNVKRAIKKGSGDAGGEDYEELTYEGYGPEGIALVVDCLTDNRNRSAADIKSIFNKNNGSFGVSGSVSWMFNRMSQFIIEGEKADEELLMDIVLDAGAEDIIVNDGVAEVLGPADAFADIQDALEKAEIETVSGQVSKIPENVVEVTEVDVAKKVLRLIDALEDNDDVQNVYGNFDMSDEIAQQAMEG